ncbi:LamG domain-containing protein [Ralstonia sp. R-29]|uniref:LamG domain-containing protein n=1 Tax=Ralstonia sp. R-29 TaxID=3404059 RepID=UPI003CF00590
MQRIVLALCVPLIALPALAETIQFAQDKPGTLPAGWVAGVTGTGSPKWTVELDPTAPGGGHVLKQSGVGDFPWCVKQGTAIADGFVEVKFKPIGGREDEAGGVVWRWKNGDNYYVARANALENNVSLYYTIGGRRHTIRYQDAPVTAQAWHTLRVEFAGNHIQLSLDGKRYIDVTDEHITGAGMVGVWTKADSVTAFDAFAYGTTTK